jgi:hypothetical protein
VKKDKEQKSSRKIDKNKNINININPKKYDKTLNNINHYRKKHLILFDK